MIRTLRITNFELIEDLTIPFEKGLNVLTGETGAGKTILLEALGLLLGRRAEAGSVRPGATQARVEGIWELDKKSPVTEKLSAAGLAEAGQELSIRRDLGADGKGRSYVNGSPVTVSFLKDLAENLVRVHGQGDGEGMRGLIPWMDLLDQHAGLGPQREKIRALLEREKGLTAEMEELGGDPQERAKKIEFLRFQADEIERAKLQDGEEERVVSALKVQQNAGRILAHLSSAERLLDGDSNEGGALASLGRAVTELRAASSLGTPTGDLADQAEALESAGRDILRQASRVREGVAADPDEAERLSERLDLIRSLQRKYGSRVEEILEKGRALREELARLLGGEDRLIKLRRERDSLIKDLRSTSMELRSGREASGTAVASGLRGELEALHLRQARLDLVWEPLVQGGLDAGQGLWVGPRGADALKILFTANPGLPSLPLGAVASGGELSRVSLALLAVLGTESGLGSYVFDEIDAGVGGEAVWALGRRLEKLAKSSQVLVVTHQAAVARFGTHHLRVSKEVRAGTTRLAVSPVEGEERIGELARMIGGKELGPKALDHARDLFRKT